MISPAIIDAMVSSGCTAEQIAAVVKADMAEFSARIEAKRANNNERQRRHRERYAEDRRNADNALQPLDNASNANEPLSLSPNDINSNPHTHTPVNTTRARAGKFPAPEGVTVEQWAGFAKQRKKPLNERSYSLLLGKLAGLAADGWPPGEMIDLATLRGWETVFAPKDFANGRQLQPTNSLRGSRPDPSLDMLRQAQAEIRASEDQGDDRAAWAALPSYRAN